MLFLHDRVLDLETGKHCFIIEIDNQNPEGCRYGIEAEDLSENDWLRWAKAEELEKCPKDEGRE